MSEYLLESSKLQSPHDISFHANPSTAPSVDPAVDPGWGLIGQHSNTGPARQQATWWQPIGKQNNTMNWETLPRKRVNDYLQTRYSYLFGNARTHGLSYNQYSWFFLTIHTTGSAFKLHRNIPTECPFSRLRISHICKNRTIVLSERT